MGRDTARVHEDDMYLWNVGRGIVKLLYHFAEQSETFDC